MTPLPTRGWAAYLQPNPAMQTLEVLLYRAIGGADFPVQYVTALHADQPPTLAQAVEAAGRDAQPTPLRIPEDVAAALFGALLHHFGGPGADRELRADYLHERGRVDRLLEVLVRPPVMVAEPAETVRYPGAAQ